MSSQYSRPTPKERWEYFKPTIEQFYMTEKMKVSEVAAAMKKDHGFDAGENQYKYHFKKWKWKRSIPTQKKDKIAAHLQSRAAEGKMSGTITYKGRQVDKNKIRRYLKDTACSNAHDNVLSSASAMGSNINGIFLRWNLPHAAMFQFPSRSYDHVSPLGFSAPTPGSDIVIESPSGSANSPVGAPSPTGVLIRRKTANDRARLFIQGRHDQLLKTLNKEEKIVMSDWLYQYWFYCFKTAKTWGRGPRTWTADTLRFDHFQHPTRHSLPGTPQNEDVLMNDVHEAPEPHKLCRWLIHLRPDIEEDYESIPEQPTSADSPTELDPNDESTWSEWPTSWQEPPLQTRLRNALEHNDFSTIQAQSLPVAIPHIVQATARSPDELLLESLGFSIMSRNIDQVRRLAEEIMATDIDTTSLYPFHLATSYLDGFKTCCSLLTILEREVGMRQNYKNEAGHTVLDNLMISILKSHSSISPNKVDSNMRNINRFPGEEVDICGRWDADSDCVRHLLSSGSSSVPFSWKHTFCHTSVQTICHSIMVIEGYMTNSIKEEPSGLYLRQCFNCGTKLQLTPFHTLTMTAYNLASYGCQGEDLFGMIACLLCLVSSRFDPREQATISITALLHDIDLEHTCDHLELSAADMCDRLTDTPQAYSWSPETQTGWDVFRRLLRLCQDNFDSCTNQLCSDADLFDNLPGEDAVAFTYRHHFIGDDLPGDNLEKEHHRAHQSREPFGSRHDLASLWASIQAELSSYRPLTVDCERYSPYFSMQDLLSQLQQGELLASKYVQEGLLQTHCVCGVFDTYGPVPTLSDTTTKYIANLDVWQRATYLPLDED